MKKTTVDLTLIKNKVKVCLSWIGEGHDGDYNENDKDDEPLLRFDVFAHISLKNENTENNGEAWQEMRDSSYCTHLNAFNLEAAKKAADFIMKEVGPEVREGASIKKICQRLSWVATKDFDK